MNAAIRMSVLLSFAGLAAWFAPGCSDDACTPHASTRCENNVTYWVDSCGHREEPHEACQYGCAVDGTRCAGSACTPNCTGKECGPDGCGGFCNPGCSGGKMCDLANGQCECASHTATQCTNDKTYYLDSCGNLEALKEDCTCGCSDSGLECKKCDCSPTCDDAWTCGDDGCGGTCGAGCDTGGGQVCNPVTRQCECTPKASYACHDGDIWWFDSCGNAHDIKSKCTSGCTGQECTGCTPDCANKQCGDDGCGGECGTGCPDNQVCHPETAQCLCVSHHHPACYDTDGDDATDAVWWFDSCGNPEEQRQDCGDAGCLNATCLDCTPNCTGKECGPDGCGGDCSPGCSGGKQCNTSSGICVCAPHFGTGCDADDVYWYDSCGTREELKEDCGSGICDPQTRECQACQPACGEGFECGPDGCGGTCGDGCDTDSGETCNEEHACVCTPDHSTACQADGQIHYVDSCGNAQDAIAIDCQGNGCDEASDECNTCTPACDPDWECGPDSCGGATCESAVDCGWGGHCYQHVCGVCDVDHPCDGSHICVQECGTCWPTCGYVYTRNYQISVTSLEVEYYRQPESETGEFWDPNPYQMPDLIVCFFHDSYVTPAGDDVDDAVFCTNTIEDFLPRYWDHALNGFVYRTATFTDNTFIDDIEALDRWVITVFDEDTWLQGGDEIMGRAVLDNSFPVEAIKAGMSDQGLVFYGLNVRKLVIHIEPQPDITECPAPCQI